MTPLENNPEVMVIQGGQTGVDRGGHDAAIDNGWRIGGFMPRDARDEQGSIPPDVARFLRTCEKPGYAARTEANVRDCDALLVIVQDAKAPHATPGTAKTISLAAERRLRRMIVDPGWSATLIARWIWHDLLAFRTLPLPIEVRELDPVRLMIAGPRESKWPGARTETAELLRRVGGELQRINQR